MSRELDDANWLLSLTHFVQWAFVLMTNCNEYSMPNAVSISLYLYTATQHTHTHTPIVSYETIVFARSRSHTCDFLQHNYSSFCHLPLFDNRKIDSDRRDYWLPLVRQRIQKNSVYFFVYLIWNKFRGQKTLQPMKENNNLIYSRRCNGRWFTAQYLHEATKLDKLSLYFHISASIFCLTSIK